MKNVLQPLLTALLALPLLDGAEARVAVMLMAVPSGAFGVLFAVRYGVASVEIGTMLIASTLLSTLTLTAAILLCLPGAELDQNISKYSRCSQSDTSAW
jgi:malonate transporter